MNTLKIPMYVKFNAIKALNYRKTLPKYLKFGLDKKEADKLGIESGIERAKLLIRKKEFNWNNAKDRNALKSMMAFYNRWRNCKTTKCEWNMKTWGTRKFLREKVIPFIKKMQR